MTNKTKSVVFMLISAFAFAVTQAFVKLAGDLPSYEKVFFRNIISLLIAAFICYKNGSILLGKKESMKFLISRSLLGAIGMVLYFYSISHLILADAAILNKLSPFFVTIFAVIFLKERISKIQVPSMIIIFLAALLIVKPRFELSILPALAGFSSAIFAGAAYTLVRVLGKKERPETIIFVFSLITTLLMFLMMILGTFTIPSPKQLFFLLSTGVTAAVGQFGLTHAYRLAPANEVAIYNYTSIVFAGILGFIFWRELPDILSLIGSITIVFVSIYLYFYNKRV
jgi:drug/metabolite transporter (DMT)-like permease